MSRLEELMQVKVRFLMRSIFANSLMSPHV